jgi:hypothetical protein
MSNFVSHPFKAQSAQMSRQWYANNAVPYSMKDKNLYVDESLNIIFTNNTYQIT